MSRPTPCWLLVVTLAACGSSRPGDARTVAGTVAGLAGSGLVLQLNGGHDLAVPPGSSSFRFASTALPEGSLYVVTVSVQPANPVQSCLVSNGRGVVGAVDVTTVEVSCVTENVCANVTCPPAADRCHVAGTCDPATVQCSPPTVVPCPAGQDCDPADGACKPSNRCATVTCPVPADRCHVAGTCLPATGQCSAQAAVQCPANQSCDLADGVCKPTVRCSGVTCPPAADACHVAGTCDPATGTCAAPTLVSCPTGQICDPSSGACIPVCTQPTPDRCGAQCVDLQSSVQNCQACGHACSFPNASASCHLGACVMGTCATGWADCLNGPADGCETYLLGSDAANCGACGHRCLVGQVCSSGTCVENTVTCSTAGVTCSQSGCYDGGHYAVTPGIAVDLLNGRRLWTRATRGPAGHFDAQSDCSGLGLEGITGWRLPTYAELAVTLYKPGGLQGCPVCAPAVDQAVFPGTVYLSSDGYYWTSDLRSGYGWETVYYCDGRKNYPFSTGTLPYRCTHDPLP